MLYLRITRILGVWNIDGRVYDWDEVASVSMKLSQELFPERIGERVQVIIKVSVLIHVINISPKLALGHSQFICKNSFRGDTKRFPEEFQTFRGYLQRPAAATSWHIPIYIGESQMSSTAVMQGVQRRSSGMRRLLLVVLVQHKNRVRCLLQ